MMKLAQRILNERKKLIYKNKSLADKFRMYEIDRQLRKRRKCFTR